MEFRDYQKECLDIINNLDGGSHLVVMATGLGKTYVFTHIKRKGRVLILSHRDELVHQPEKYYTDCSFGVEMSSEHSNGEDVVSASVQTLKNRLSKFKPDDFDLLITDEAHHATADTYKKIYAYFKPRLHLGFTATPNRADNVRLGEIFSDIIYKKDVKWGIANNYLTNIRCMKTDVGFDLRNVRTRMGDYAEKDLSSAIDLESVNDMIAKIYKENAIGQTLIFGVSKDHCNHLREKIPEAEVVLGDTPNRGEILQNFLDEKCKCIISCMVLTEGTDLPNVRTIIMCRPTKNASLFTQIVGRGLRKYPGKTELLLIDCVGSSSNDICTAPVLFDMTPKEAYSVNTSKRLLTDVYDELNQKEYEKPGAWKINLQLIDMFEKSGNYDTHDINFIMGKTGILRCSLSHKISLCVDPEDMTGNTTVYIKSGKDKIIFRSQVFQMQDALNYAYYLLKNRYGEDRNLWDMERVKRWGSGKASPKQIKFVRSLYGKTLSDDEYKNLTKYNASVLIDRKTS